MRSNKEIIYLADLTHTKNGIMALTFPLGTAYVTAYAKQNLGNEFEFTLFKFPEDLTEQLVVKKPRVLALSSYQWNVELGYNVSLWAKKLYPDLIIIMGGPNFPTSSNEKLSFLMERENIDFYIENEGEVGFTSLLEKLQDYGFNSEKLKDSEEIIPNCTYLKYGGEKIPKLIEADIKRIIDINSIPSPYLSGVLDRFFDYSLTPMLETTRGCPFSCTYCADGLSTKNKVTAYDINRVEEELYYIANKIKNIDEMYITDLNFGMYPKDIKTAELISRVQKDLNFPSTIFATTGKNNAERVIEVAKLLKGSWITGPAIQTSDEQVLKNVKRSNIRSDAYKKISEYMHSIDDSALTFTELILGLPGDTKKKHFESLRYAIDSKMTKIKAFQAMMLLGTEMASPETRERFGLVCKYRITAGGVGVYKFNEEKISIAEIHEIIVSSKDMSFEDWLSCRVMHLLLESYHNQQQFKEFFLALLKLGISEFDFIVYLYENDDLFKPRIKEIIKRYLDTIKDNLYDTYEEAVDVSTSSENVEKYESGELGFNELMHCNLDMHFAMEDTLLTLLSVLKRYLKEKNIYTQSVMNYFEQLGRFILLKKRDVVNSQTETEEDFYYDFENLYTINFDIDPREIKKLKSPIRYKFFHNDRQRNIIKNAVGLYENHTDGIARMVYSNNLQRLYRNVERITPKIGLQHSSQSKTKVRAN